MPTQISVAGISLNSYTVFITLAALLGVAWALWHAPESGHTRSATLNAMIWIALAALIAGRLGYGLLHLSYFREYPRERLAEVLSTTASPGYAEHAAIVGGLLGWLIARRLHQRVDAHALVLTATLIGIGASIGCIPNGCAYGREVFWTDGWLWSLRVDWPDAYSINNPRLPAQMFTAAWLMLCLFITLVVARHFSRYPVASNDGVALLLVWLLLFALGDFIIQCTRADATTFIAGIRAEQWLDVVFVLASIIGLVRTATKTKSNTPTFM